MGAIDPHEEAKSLSLKYDQISTFDLALKQEFVVNRDATSGGAVKAVHKPNAINKPKLVLADPRYLDDAALDRMFRELTGREPTAEDRAECARIDAMTDEEFDAYYSERRASEQ